jgi:hypothetical protein
MPRAKRTVQSAVTIDGFSLVWRLHREEQTETSAGAKGMCIHVTVAEGVRRELHIEYQPAEKKAKGPMIVEPTRRMILPKMVEEHIREALAGGWDPESRGKPFIWFPDELPG